MKRVPACPTIEACIESAHVQANADRSQLAQLPYVTYLDGIGWIVDSISSGGQLPSIAGRHYDVSVLPSDYHARNLAYARAMAENATW